MLKGLKTPKIMSCHLFELLMKSIEASYPKFSENSSFPLIQVTEVLAEQSLPNTRI